MSTQYQPHPMNIANANKKVISQLLDDIITSVVTQQTSQEISTQTDPCVDVIDRMSEEFDTETQRLTKENEFLEEKYERVKKLHSQMVKEMDYWKMKCLEKGEEVEAMEYENEALEEEREELEETIHLMREDRGDFLSS
jgi:DNA repair ATPase RecN